MLTLEDVKQFLKVDYEDEDSLIETFIEVSKLMLIKIISRNYDDLTEIEVKLANVYILASVAEMFNNRELTIEKNEQKVRHIYKNILSQLKYGGE